MTQLTPAQKAIKAKNKIALLALKADLTDLSSYLNELFEDPEINVPDATSKEEIQSLISAINNGTASNAKITRYLELAELLPI